MEDVKQQTGTFARLVITTSLVTIIVVCGLVFTFRESLTSYVFQLLRQQFEALVPSIPTVVSDEARIVSAIAKVDPAVVSIIVSKDVPIYEQYYETINPWGFFGGLQIPRIRENGTEEQEVGGGTGFIVSSDGLIVTNRHVVSDEDARYSVMMTNGTVYDASVVALDPQLDIAVIKISNTLESVLPTVLFGDSDSLQLGQTVIAIGNALAEFQNSVSVGVISGLSRSIVASDGLGLSEQLNQVIQTDAAINPGNSGGPLLNIDGEVIGVNVATSRGADNIGFALPAALVRQVVESVREYGEIIRPFLGVRYVMLNQELSQTYETDVTYGALITNERADEAAIQPGSAAERAGLQEGDIILAIDGQSLAGRDLATVLRTKSVGDVISLEVMRNGVQETISATLEKAL